MHINQIYVSGWDFPIFNLFTNNILVFKYKVHKPETRRPVMESNLLKQEYLVTKKSKNLCFYLEIGLKRL